METTQRLTALLEEKFFDNIIIHKNERNRNLLIVDVNDGAIFSILNNFLFAFKNCENHTWSTVPMSMMVNHKLYYPKLGDQFKIDGEVKYQFTTKEEVIKMACDYFKKFIIPYYGLELHWRMCDFTKVVDEIELTYKLSHKRFRCSEYQKIEAYISAN